MSRDNDKKAYKSKSFQVQNQSLRFIVKIYSLPSATSTLSHSPMAFNTSASLDKLTDTEYEDFGKIQDRYGQFFGPILIPTTWMFKLKSSKETKIDF